MKTLPQEAFGQVSALPFLGFSSIWEMANPPVEVCNNYLFIVLMNSKWVSKIQTTQGRIDALEKQVSGSLQHLRRNLKLVERRLAVF